MRLISRIAIAALMRATRLTVVMPTWLPTVVPRSAYRAHRKAPDAPERHGQPPDGALRPRSLE